MSALPPWAGYIYRGTSSELQHVNLMYYNRVGRLIGLRSNMGLLLRDGALRTGISAYNAELGTLHREYSEWRRANGHGPIPLTKAEAEWARLTGKP